MKSQLGESKRKGIFTFCKPLTIPVKSVFTIEWSGGRGGFPAATPTHPPRPGGAAKCRVNVMVK